MKIFFALSLAMVASAAANPDRRPNLLFILTDDLDVELGGLSPLVKTRDWIANQGAWFNNAFVSTTVCCPSRSSILTGRYQHNTAVVNNSIAGNCASQAWRSGPEQETFATQLHSAGYTTFYAGKYLNEYGKHSIHHVPPGWDHWAGLVGNSQYYNYTLILNGGRIERHGDNYTEDYLTDVIGRKAHHFLDQYLPNDDDDDDDTPPFLMVLSTPAPHAPFTPAPQYANAFSDHRAPRTPSFNHVSDDKHWLVRTKPAPMNDTIIEKVDEAFRNRWRTLLSVDDLVDSVLGRLDKSGLLDNTHVVFTSDHGYHLGTFALPLDKRQPYETDLRVPLLVRGPGIPAGRRVEEAVVVTIDMAPTLLDMAGVATSESSSMDGVSFLPWARSAAADDDSSRRRRRQRSFLVEYQGEGGNGNDPECSGQVDMHNMAECSAEWDCKCQDARNNTYTCVRNVSDRQNNIYCVFEDGERFEEEYDMNEDPFQLVNRAARRGGSGRDGVVVDEESDQRLSQVRIDII